MKRLIKIIRKIVVTLMVILFLFVGLAILLSSIYEEEVKNYVISKIDEEFSADIYVEKIALNFWRKFPNASLQFQNVSIKDDHITENPPIFVARDLFLQFDVFDLLNHKYILRKAAAKGGKIDILIYKSGNNNFDLFKESSDTSDFFFSLKEFNLTDIEFAYENQSTLQSYNMILEDINLPLKMTSKGFNCGIKGGLSVGSYRSEGVEIIKNRSLRINAGVSYNTEKQRLMLTQSSLNVQGVELTLKGSFELSNTTSTNLTIEAQKLDINRLKPLLPSSVISYLEEYSISGILNFSATISGELGGKRMPKIDADFSVNKASMSSAAAGLNLNNLVLKGVFSNGRNRSLESSSLEIPSFTGMLNSEEFSGGMRIKNFRNTRISANFNSNLNMAALKKMARLETFDIFEGRMRTEIRISIRLNHFLNNPQLVNYDYKGKLLFKEAKIKLHAQKVTFSEINGNLSFDKNQIFAEGLSLMVLGSKLKAKAQVFNYLNMVLPVNSLPYRVQADIVGDNISYSNLMQIIEIETDGEASNPWKANLNFAVKRFSWEDAVFTNFRGEFFYGNDQWSIRNTTSNFSGGKLLGSINYRPINQNSGFSFNGSYKAVNINKVFHAFHNFNQSTLTADNISGFATGSFSGNMIFDDKSELIPSSLKVQSNITIEKGRLQGVKELNALSDYTKINDFSDINFSTLSNNITIANQKIIIPKMHISSDKMDMDVFGTHNFENDYNYHFDILLADILGQKINKTEDNEFGIIEDDGYGKTRIFLNLYSNGEDFTVKYDKKEASGKIKEDVKQEGTELKNTIKQEFINAHRDSLRRAKKAAKKAEKQKLKDQENGKFIIEWDEGDTTDVDY